MAIRTELSLRLPNSPGALAGVCRLLADERVSILALAVESTGQVRMVVDNHVRGLGVLRERHHRVETRDVLVLPVANAPGGLAPMLQLVADAGVNVEYAYGAAPETSVGAVVVLGVDDPLRAASRAGV
jgi:hypothetical protein